MLYTQNRVAAAATVLLSGCGLAYEPEANTVQFAQDAAHTPIAIEGLRARSYESRLIVTRDLGGFHGYHSHAVTWDSDGLRQSAVMNVPATPAPDAGYPVLIMCHGNANGRWDMFKEYYSDAQDTDHYRRLSHAPLITRYAREGFVVLFPDYRGHGYSETNGRNERGWQLDRDGNKVLDRDGNPVPRIFDKDGLRFGGWLYSAHYTVDVLHLMAALRAPQDLPPGLSLDLDNVFLWGRSLGGDVAARAMTVNPAVRAASLWVPATTSLWDQAHHYHYDSPCCADGFSLEALLVELRNYNAVHGSRLRASELNPSNYVDLVRNPVLVQVSIDDTGVRSAWGIQYHFELLEADRESQLIVHPGDAHVFTGETLEQAISADLEFFRAAMR